MILPKPNRLNPEQVAEITAITKEFDCHVQPIIGDVRTIYAIVGDERDDLMINRLEGLSYIEKIDRIQSPFKLMTVVPIWPMAASRLAASPSARNS